MIRKTGKAKKDNSNSIGEFYRTLFACLLSVTLAFYILFMTELKGCKDTFYYSGLISNWKFPLGSLIILAITGIAIIFPVRLFFKYQTRLRNGTLYDVFVVVLGSFPFFVQNMVATLILFIKHCEFKYNLAYVFIYFVIFLILLMKISMSKTQQNNEAQKKSYISHA